MAKDDYNSQGYSTDGHCHVLLIWLYLQQAEQMLFQHQDSIQRRIIWAQKSTHRNCIENTFCIMYLIKKNPLFNYLNTQSFLTFKKRKRNSWQPYTVPSTTVLLTVPNNCGFILKSCKELASACPLKSQDSQWWVLTEHLTTVNYSCFCLILHQKVAPTKN